MELCASQIRTSIPRAVAPVSADQFKADISILFKVRKLPVQLPRPRAGFSTGRTTTSTSKPIRTLKPDLGAEIILHDVGHSWRFPTGKRNRKRARAQCVSFDSRRCLRQFSSIGYADRRGRAGDIHSLAREHRQELRWSDERCFRLRPTWRINWRHAGMIVLRTRHLYVLGRSTSAADTATTNWSAWICKSRFSFVGPFYKSYDQ